MGNISKKLENQKNRYPETDMRKCRIRKLREAALFGSNLDNFDVWLSITSPHLVQSLGWSQERARASGRLTRSIETPETRTDRDLSSEIIQRQTSTFRIRLSTFLESIEERTEKRLDFFERQLRNTEGSFLSMFFSRLAIHTPPSQATFIHERDNVNGVP